LLSWATPFFKGGVIAALLLIAFLAGAGLVRQRGAVQPDDMLARALVAHHRSTDTSMDELGISSEDPNAVATWFQTQLPFPVRVSVLTDAHLLGGRVRSVFGEPTALVLYEQDGTRLSLFTLPPRGGLGVRKATPSSNATRPRCSVVFGKYAFCLQESEDAVHAVVAEGVTKGEELAHRLLTAQIDE
jgi:anti-sigma factor RsiW